MFGSTEKSAGNDAKTCLMGLRNVRLYSQPILVQLGAEDSDAYIQKKIYTSQDVTVNDGNAFKAGALKFRGFDNSVVNKFFYDDDTVLFEPVWDSSLTDDEKDALYLWGFKIQTKAGGMPDFYYIKGDSFKISDLYLGKLKDSLTGVTIGTQAQQSMSVNGESFTCYRIFPVYKQKTAYTTVQDDKAESDGLSFAANTFNYNQTIKTGRLDTIQIRIAATGDNNVKGFDYRYENYNQVSVTSAETERSLDSEKSETASARALPYYKKNWNQYGGFLNSDAALPQNLDFTPLGTDNVLYVSGELSDIDMTVHPAANSASDQSKGAAAYVTDDGTVKTAQFDRVDAGLLKGSSIDISPYKVGKPYQFFAAINEEDKYLDKNHILTLQWTDMTGDINKDGVLSKEEEFALGENAEFIQRNSFSGETFVSDQ